MELVSDLSLKDTGALALSSVRLKLRLLWSVVFSFPMGLEDSLPSNHGSNW